MTALLILAACALGVINGFYVGDHLAWLKMAEYVKRYQSDALQRERQKVKECQAELRRLAHLVNNPHQGVPVKRSIDVASSLRLYGIDPATTEHPDDRFAYHG